MNSVRTHITAYCLVTVMDNVHKAWSQCPECRQPCKTCFYRLVVAGSTPKLSDDIYIYIYIVLDKDSRSVLRIVTCLYCWCVVHRLLLPTCLLSQNNSVYNWYVCAWKYMSTTVKYMTESVFSDRTDQILGFRFPWEVFTIYIRNIINNGFLNVTSNVHDSLFPCE
jgi:hypothetical protein